MSVFQKKMTTRDVNILGKIYSVEFNRDSLATVFSEVQEGLEAIMEEAEVAQYHEKIPVKKIQEDEKKLLKNAIEKILNLSHGEQNFFLCKESLLLYREIYAYLAGEFIYVVQAESPYSIERIAGYESFN